MADTNTYDSFQKVEKWTTRDKFNALDLSTIETGTEYNLTEKIGANDLDSELLVGINGKLTAPTKPLEYSAVTMLEDGTTGTKPLTEFEPFRYRHTLWFTMNLSNYNEVHGSVQFKNNYGTAYGNASEIEGIYTLHLSGVLLGTCSLYVGSNSMSLYGVVFSYDNTSTPVILNEENITNFSMTDSVEEL